MSRYHPCFYLVHLLLINQGSSAPTTSGTSGKPTTSSYIEEVEDVISVSHDMCSGSKKNSIQHPEQCALYYNCSSLYTVVPRYMEQNLYECPYPQLFSTKTGKCENYHRVECGQRNEPKWQCQYRKFWCKDEDCSESCSSKYPTCIGKGNGYSQYSPGRTILPYYIECQDERVKRIKLCPRVPVRMNFSPLLNRCARLNEIPMAYNDIKKVCQKRKNGNHSDIYRRCKNYFRCENGRFAFFGTCQGSKMFDQIRGICAEPETICGRCGNRRSKCSKSKDAASTNTVPITTMSINERTSEATSAQSGSVIEDSSQSTVEVISTERTTETGKPDTTETGKPVTTETDIDGSNNTENISNGKDHDGNIQNITANEEKSETQNHTTYDDQTTAGHTTTDENIETTLETASNTDKTPFTETVESTSTQSINDMDYSGYTHSIPDRSTLHTTLTTSYSES